MVQPAVRSPNPRAAPRLELVGFTRRGATTAMPGRMQARTGGRQGIDPRIHGGLFFWLLKSVTFANSTEKC